MRALIVLVTLFPSLAFAAGDGRNYGIQTPPSWTLEVGDPEPIVDVNAWFTEGSTIVTAGVFVGPLLPGVLRDIDGSVFLGSGRTICLNATAERTGQPSTRVMAVPACSTFPVFELVAPGLQRP